MDKKDLGIIAIIVVVVLALGLIATNSVKITPPKIEVDL